MKKAIILFSGGLDSRLTAKIIEKQGFEIHLCFVKLPFGGGCGSSQESINDFAKNEGYHLHIIDATKNKLYSEYIDIILNPKYGIGSAINPCKDCKIFIFLQGKKLMKEINADLIATGEVIGQRPMSQMKKTLMFDDSKAGLENKILRPLSAKILPKTIYEKSGLINGEELFAISGRRRIEQISLAQKFNIKYPEPGGGCLLCEKEYGKKFKGLFNYLNRKPTFEETLFLKRGRMFQDKGLLFVGRDSKENLFIAEVAKKINWNIFFREDIPGPTVVYDKLEDKQLAKDLWVAYSGNKLEQRQKFDKFKI